VPKHKLSSDPDYAPSGHRSKRPSTLVPKLKRFLVRDDDDIDDTDDAEHNDAEQSSAVAEDKSKLKRKIKGPPATKLLNTEPTVPKQKLSSDPDYTATVHKSDIGRKRKHYSAVRKPLPSEELHLVMHAFQKNVADGSVPGYPDWKP